MSGTLGSILTALFKAFGDFFNQREQEIKRDAAQREITRLQLENNARKAEAERLNTREKVVEEVSRLNDTDLFNSLRK